MSTQRYISTSFWDDEWVQTLNLMEKGLYLYFLSNTLTNIAGIYKISDRRILFDTGLSDNKFKEMFDKFEKAGKAYRHDEYIIIPKWPKHQKWETHSKIKVGIEAILKNLPSELLAFVKTIGYTYPIDTLSIGYDSQFFSESDQKYPSNYSDSDSDIDSDSDMNGVSGEPPQSMKDAIELSNLLLTSHRLEIPDYLSGKKDAKTIQRWAADIERLIRLDKKSPDVIRQVIQWVKTPGNFWFHNIESGAKLRKQFERLFGEMTSKRSGTKPTSHRIAADNRRPDKLDQYFN